MSPATIIKNAAQDGVVLELNRAGGIEAIGERAKVERWLPKIREFKPQILAVLQQAANDDSISNPKAEVRRQRVLEMLAEKPGARHPWPGNLRDSDSKGEIRSFPAARSDREAFRHRSLKAIGGQDLTR
jgi:hypothetical protein